MDAIKQSGMTFVSTSSEIVMTEKCNVSKEAHGERNEERLTPLE
jgi:hypothetical protein